MRIGEHVVTEVTKDSAKVGCQKVTKVEVEALLAEMKAAVDKFVLKVAGSGPGTVYLSQSGDSVILHLVGKNGFDYNVLLFGPNGIELFSGCGNGSTIGVPTDSFSGKDTCVKLVGSRY